MKGMVIPIVIDALGTVTKGLVKEMGRIGNKNTTNDSTLKIDQNTQKSPGELRRRAVTQTPLKDHLLMLVGKTLMQNNYNNNIQS